MSDFDTTVYKREWFDEQLRSFIDTKAEQGGDVTVLYEFFYKMHKDFDDGRPATVRRMEGL